MSAPEQSFADMLREEEDRLVAQARAEIAAEEAAWNALSDEERAAINAERAAKWDAFADAADAADADSEDDEEEEEDDSYDYREVDFDDRRTA